MEDLPNNWLIVPLNTVVQINPSQPERDIDEEEYVSFVPMRAVEEHTGRLDPAKTRPWKEIRTGYKRFQEGDVLFAKITPSMENGKVAIAERLHGGVGAGSTEFHVLRPSCALHGRYLLYYLVQDLIRGEAQSQMQGTAGQLRVPQSFFDELSVPLPPFNEQIRIVEELEASFTRLEAAVAALKRTRVNLGRFRASILKAACEGRLVPTEAELARGESRNYAPTNTLLKKIFSERHARWEAEQLEKLRAHGKMPTDDRWKRKYSEPAAPDAGDLPELPEGWAWATVEQLSPADRPCTYGVVKPGKDMLDDGVSFVRVGDLTDTGRIMTDRMKRIEPSIASKYDRSRLRGGEVLISLVGTIGRTAVVPDELAGANVARAIGVIAVVPGISSRWVELWFRNPEQVARMTAKAHEVARKTLNLEDVRRAVVALPPFAEQMRIVAEVESHESIALAAEAALDVCAARAQRLRQAILKRAFKGRLVPQDPDDEPASVLLKKINRERLAATGNPSGV